MEKDSVLGEKDTDVVGRGTVLSSVAVRDYATADTSRWLIRYSYSCTAVLRMYAPHVQLYGLRDER